MIHRRTGGRRAAAMLEFATVAPCLILLLFGVVIGGLGMFRYHQVAALAHAAARHAAVRGRDYERETGKPAATQESILKDVVLANAAGLDPAQLTCTVTWNRSNAANEFLPDKTVVGNVVSVRVSYLWVPEGLFGALTLTSTSKVPMSY
jgi:Flp pilus assembly protein TadG